MKRIPRMKRIWSAGAGLSWRFWVWLGLGLGVIALLNWLAS